jgi:hypothetical protein
MSIRVVPNWFKKIVDNRRKKRIQKKHIKALTDSSFCRAWSWGECIERKVMRWIFIFEWSICLAAQPFSHLIAFGTSQEHEKSCTSCRLGII